MKSRFDPLQFGAGWVRPRFKEIACLFPAVLLLIVVFSSKASFAQGRATVDKISSQIESMFPLLEGYVVSVEGDRLTLDFKQGQSISKGDKLSLVRYGADIIHPVSKKKIGRKETDLGEVEVLEVRPDFTIARLLNTKAEVKAGDGARLPFKQISLLVAPPKINGKKKIDAQQLQVNLQNSLGGRARFKIPPFELGLWMLENDLDLKGLLNPANLSRLQKEVAVNFILAPEVKSLKGKTVLGYKLYSAKDGSIRRRARVLARSLPEESERSDERPRRRASRRRQIEDSPFQLVTKQNFRFRLVDLDVADVTGNGKNELILVNENRVMIYRLREGGKFKRVAQYSPRGEDLEIMSVDAVDLNGNGRAEIFVTCREGDHRLSSFVIEVKGKRFQKVWSGVNRYFRAMRSFGKAPVMMTQKPGFQDPIHGAIETVKFDGGKYRIGPALKLPEKYGLKFILYGLNQGALPGRKGVNTIIIDNDFHLRVYSPDARIVYKSEEYYGHDPRLNDLGISVDSSGLVKEGAPVRYKGRVELLQQNSGRYVALPFNHKIGGSWFGGAIHINSNSLAILSLESDGISKYFITKKQKGYQAGFRIVKENKENSLVYMGSVEKDERGGEGVSTVAVYNWRN